MDITDQIDLGTTRASTGVTRGPAGKGFDEDLGISAADLKRMVKELIEIEVRGREGG